MQIFERRTEFGSRLFSIVTTDRIREINRPCLIVAFVLYNLDFVSGCINPFFSLPLFSFNNKDGRYSFEIYSKDKDLFMLY